MITEHKPKKLTLNEIERTTWEARAVMSKQKLKCNNSTKQMNYNNDKDKVGIKVANIKVKELYFLKEKQKLKGTENINKATDLGNMRTKVFDVCSSGITLLYVYGWWMLLYEVSVACTSNPTYLKLRHQTVLHTKFQFYFFVVLYELIERGSP